MRLGLEMADFPTFPWSPLQLRPCLAEQSPIMITGLSLKMEIDCLCVALSCHTLCSEATCWLQSSILNCTCPQTIMMFIPIYETLNRVSYLFECPCCRRLSICSMSLCSPLCPTQSHLIIHLALAFCTVMGKSLHAKMGVFSDAAGLTWLNSAYKVQLQLSFFPEKQRVEADPPTFGSTLLDF